MNLGTKNDRSAAARALAYVVAGNGFIDKHELDVLEGLGALTALGMDRRQFGDLVSARLAEIDGSLKEQSWLPRTIEALFEEALDAVLDPDQRRLVCRLAMALHAQEAGPADEQRMLIEHMLAHWRIPREAVETPPARGETGG